MLTKQFMIGTSLLALQTFQSATAQRFSADAAIGVGPGTQMGAPFTANTAAEEIADPADPDTVLERQGFDATRIFSRTCDCVRRGDDELVRFFLQYWPLKCTSLSIKQHACSVRQLQAS